jgi:transcriptional regulator with XRE-family HTH domain
MIERNIGQRVNRLRKSQGLTTVDLAQKIGISQAQISRLENGKQGFRSVTLDKIAKAFGVRVIDLVAEDEGGSLSPQLAKAINDPGFLVFIDQAAGAYLADPKALAALNKALVR